MRTEFDEHTQESFDDDSVNLGRVASYRLDGSGRLAIDFHNSYGFDSARLRQRPDKIAAAISEFKRIAG
jgi:hypothetical protein